MSYFETLRKGSPFHKVSINGDGAITISPVDDSDASFHAFQRVVDDAIRNAGADYEIRPHETTQRGQRMYDFAAIWLP
jgi:hypothetical protein